MMERRTHFIWLLLLTLALIGCRPVTDGELQLDPAEAAAQLSEETELSRPTIGSEPTESRDGPEVTPVEAESDSQEEPVLSVPGKVGGSIAVRPVLSVAEGFTEEGYPFKGDPAAPVTVEDFSSYQCPFCAKYYRETYPQVVANYVETGRVRYVFRDFPLPSQPQSPLAAEAARCAGQTGGGGAYWAMHDRLLEGQREWSGKGNATEIFQGYAAELGLDAAALGECLDSGATRAKVQADSQEGSARGVIGTPTFFINGRVLVGAQPYAAFAQAMDAALAGEVPPAPEPAAPAVAPTPGAIAPVDDARVLGDPEAPVTIVEFSDYQCPFCARHFQETWPQLKVEFVDAGRVRYVFKDFPITSIHPEAPKAHQAARCAGEQEAYWEIHDRLFAGQDEWGGSPDHVAAFTGYAAELGLDTAAFDACLDGGRYADAVNADVAEGRSLGVSGTPTFFIDGYPLVGAQPYEVFRRAIGLAEQGTLGDAFRPRQ